MGGLCPFSASLICNGEKFRSCLTDTSMDSIFSPFWARRRWRRMLLAPCLGFALYIAFSYKGPTFDAVRSSSAEIGTTTITPICVHETVTEQAGFEHEV